MIGASTRCEAEASSDLLEDHLCLAEEADMQVAKLTPMHMVDWAESQDADPVLATCRKWLKTHKDTPHHRGMLPLGSSWRVTWMSGMKDVSFSMCVTALS